MHQLFEHRAKDVLHWEADPPIRRMKTLHTTTQVLQCSNESLLGQVERFHFHGKVGEHHFGEPLCGFVVHWRLN